MLGRIIIQKFPEGNFFCMQFQCKKQYDEDLYNDIFVDGNAAFVSLCQKT